jgi:hypothetical protein
MDTFQLSAVPLEELQAEIGRRHAESAAAGISHTCTLVLWHDRPNDAANGGLHVVSTVPSGSVDSIPAMLLSVAGRAVHDLLASAGARAEDPNGVFSIAVHTVN